MIYNVAGIKRRKGSSVQKARFQSPPVASPLRGKIILETILKFSKNTDKSVAESIDNFLSNEQIVVVDWKKREDLVAR